MRDEKSAENKFNLLDVDRYYLFDVMWRTKVTSQKK